MTEVQQLIERWKRSYSRQKVSGRLEEDVRDLVILTLQAAEGHVFNLTRELRESPEAPPAEILGLARARIENMQYEIPDPIPVPEPEEGPQRDDLLQPRTTTEPNRPGTLDQIERAGDTLFWRTVTFDAETGGPGNQLGWPNLADLLRDGQAQAQPNRPLQARGNRPTPTGQPEDDPTGEPF